MQGEKQAYPFAAIVGQDDLKHAIILTAIDASLGGVLAFGDRGTGKTTAVRGLASLLPKLEVIKDCRYNCDPFVPQNLCEACSSIRQEDFPETITITTPVVDLPLGITEDRLLGALDIERALLDGKKEFEPGLLANANRGFLYIDEVNLLEDHLVDLLLDVATSGWNVVEREGLSVRHPARFVLVGSGNPEEGELRPQLIDRFGLSVEVETPDNISQRVEIIKRREQYDANPDVFFQEWQGETDRLRRKILQAQKILSQVIVEDATLALIAEICIGLGTDGLRGELTLIKAARVQAAWQNSPIVTEQHVQSIAPMALSHRLRRNPLDDARSTVRVKRVLEEIFNKRDVA